MIFENNKLKIEYVEECIYENSNIGFVFSIDIKDFDTPIVNVVYDIEENVISKTYIEEKFENIPKSHVAYKMFTLIEYEVIDIIQFMIRHI